MYQIEPKPIWKMEKSAKEKTDEDFKEIILASVYWTVMILVGSAGVLGLLGRLV